KAIMANEAEKTAPPAKKGKGWLILIAVAALAGGSGFAVPRFLAHDTGEKKPAADKEHKKPAVISFGDVIVNLGEERLTRYLRVKIILVVDGNREEAVKEHLDKQKAYLKSW